MSVDPEEKKWTDYVLDEVELPERAELEAMMACSPQARAAVDEIRDAVELLRDGIEEDSRLRLNEDQVKQIMAAGAELSGDEVAESFVGPGWNQYTKWLKPLAALFVVAGFIGLMTIPGWVAPEEDTSLAAVAVNPNSEDAREDVRGGPGENDSMSNERGGLVAESIDPSVVSRWSLQGEQGGATQSSSGSDRMNVPHTFAPAETRAENDATVFSRPFVSVVEQPLFECTIRTAVGTYDQIQHSVWGGRLPELESVDVADLINYFSYDYARPNGGQPLSVHFEATTCPWNARHRLVQIGLQGSDVSANGLKPLKVILLVDGVEVRQGSFDRALLLQALTSLRGRKGPTGMVTVIDGSRLGGPVIRVSASEPMAGVIERLTSLPQQGGIDIGVSNHWVLAKIVKELSEVNRNEVALVLGGDDLGRARERVRVLELLDDTVPGIANYSIVGLGRQEEAWSERLAGLAIVPDSITSVSQANHFWDRLLNRANPTVAQAVRMHLEFNPEAVLAYRPVEQRLPRAGTGADVGTSPVSLAGVDVSAGQQMTALFEVVPVGPLSLPRHQSQGGEDGRQERSIERERNQVRTQNMLTVKLNYRLVEDQQAVRESYPFVDQGKPLADASEDLKFSASVAAFGMVLSDAPFRGTINHYGILELAQRGLGEDPSGDRKEFLELVKRTIKVLLRRGSRVNG